MYFANRTQAGRMLASQISRRYQGQDNAIVALSDGGVVVGAQIAMELHAVMGMLVVDEIELPQELISIAGITQNGAFSYNQAYSPGELEELVSEYRGVIEQEKVDKLREIAELLRNKSLIRNELLENHNIILVSDGLSSGFSIDLAIEYLKPISYKKIIVATPLASVNAVDRVHVQADDIFCLSVIENYMATDHYYNTPDVPKHEVVVETVSQIIKNWR